MAPSSRSQRLIARPARGSGAKATSRATVGSGTISAARSARKPESSAASCARRARSGTGSLPASPAHNGSSSWRTRFLRWRGSSLVGSSTQRRPASSHTARVSDLLSASSGCSWPGLIPARPSGPAPRSRLHRTVSAWSSIVWPVATPEGSDAKRAARARASRFGPGVTWTRTPRNDAPNDAEAAATRSASPAEPTRSPWSTWTTVTRQPASVERTSRARESGPPETAQVRGEPAGGKLQRGRRLPARPSPAIARGTAGSVTRRPASPPRERSTAPARGSLRASEAIRVRARPGRRGPVRRAPRQP